MDMMLALQIFVLQSIFFGVVIFFIRRFAISSTEGAVQRLGRETEAAHTKQIELDKKIKEASEELAKRKEEADKITKKMREEAEESVRAERDKMIKKAREDGEEIIAKAQGTKDKIRAEIEKEVELKTVDHAVKVLTAVLSDKAKGILDNQIITEFIESLEKVDMNQIGPSIDTADIITASPLDVATQEKIAKVIKGKLNRNIKINITVDAKIVAGVMLQFGSLALDGSLQNIFKDAATVLKQKIEGE